MMRLLIVLMMLLATVEAVPVQAFLAARAHKTALTCCCKGVCRCRHCMVHRPHGAKLPPGTCVVDCAGCTASARHEVTLPPTSLYERASIGTTLALGMSTRITSLISAAPASSVQRLPDPPPRPAAA